MSTDDKLQNFLHALEVQGCNPRQSGKGWMARCLCHDDRSASLSVGLGDNGKVLIHCFAGCEPEDIVKAAGFRMADLMGEDGSRKQAKRKADRKPLGKIEQTYDYRDADGTLLFQVVRYEGKDFRQRKPKLGGGWDWTVAGIRQVPFCLPEIVKRTDETVFIVEGEKDALSLLNRQGVLATCNAGGADKDPNKCKWTGDHAAYLAGRDVVILPDNDEAGRGHAEGVARSLVGVAKSIKVLELPGLPPKGDVSDWLASGGTAAELRRLANEAAEWVPTVETKEAEDDLVVPMADLVKQYPKLKDVVVDGLLRVGEVMNVIASPKIGKSWLVLMLAFCVAFGRKWLGSQCSQGRVLIVDNELHRETLADRVRCVAGKLDRDIDSIDSICVRGKGWDINSLAEYLGSKPPGEYKLIILDALYRFLPAGTSENDNAAMMAVYNVLDQIADFTQAAIVVIHHSSKGNQSEKAQTDVGSGAGSISRAADTHLTIRHHSEQGYSVLEAVTRSFDNPEPKTIFFKWPVWLESDLEPQTKAVRQTAQEVKDSETRKILAKIGEKLNGKTLTLSAIRSKTGFGLQRVQRGAMLLEQDGTAKRVSVKSRKNGQKVEALKFICTGICTAENPNNPQT